MFGLFGFLFWLACQAALLWFIIVFITQAHHTNFWDVRWQFVGYYLVSVVIGVLVSSMFGNEIIQLLVSRGILAIGLGLMLYLRYISDLKKIAIILGIFFVVTTAILMGYDAFVHGQADRTLDMMIGQE